jgi:hypothetical protein
MSGCHAMMMILLVEWGESGLSDAEQQQRAREYLATLVE